MRFKLKAGRYPVLVSVDPDVVLVFPTPRKRAAYGYRMDHYGDGSEAPSVDKRIGIAKSYGAVLGMYSTSIVPWNLGTEISRDLSAGRGGCGESGPWRSRKRRSAAPIRIPPAGIPLVGESRGQTCLKRGATLHTHLAGVAGGVR